MSGEGILLEDLVIDESLLSFDDSVFAIHLQRQYSAAIELEEFLVAYQEKMKIGNATFAAIAAAISESDDSSVQKYLHALKRCLYNETILNESYMKQKIGRPVVFGDIIQLFHVKSQKYLTVTDNQLAKEERENMMIQLDSKGSPFSWIQLAPRYKIDRDGDKINTNTEVYLKVAERLNEFVHAAERENIPSDNSKDAHVREVNCSLESSSWRLGIFQSSTASMDKSLLLSSQIVTIQDPETKSFLTIGIPKVDSLDDVGETTTMGSPAGTEALALTAEADGVETTAVTIEEPVTPEYFHEFGDIILQPYNGSRVNSNCYWIIESQALNGDPILWKTEHVRFRHLNSGVYLSLKIIEGEYHEEEPEEGMPSSTSSLHHLDVNNKMDEENGDKYIFTFSQAGTENHTYFQVNELYASNPQLGNAKALKIVQDGVWMQRGLVHDVGDEDDNAALCYMIKGCLDKDNAISLIFTRFSGDVDDEEPDKKKDASDDGDEYDVGITTKEPLDVYAGVAARFYAQKFLDMTVVPLTDGVSTIWPGADSSDMDFFTMLMQRLNYFMKGFPISSMSINEDVDKADPKVRYNRQCQLTEQRVIEVVLRMINKLIPISTQAVVIANQLKFNKVVSEDRLICNRMGQRVLKLCFDVIYSCIQDHPDNQMYVADFLPVLLAHLSVQPLAGKCVTEMLNKNMELQETKIGKREITIFINQLKEARMNAMYLGLLQSCCSCQGEGVDGNQRLVALMLFADTSDMIIKIHPDYLNLTQCDWGIRENNLYVPSAPIAGSPVMGDTLLTRGLPKLSLTWTTNSIDYSPLGLFGKLSVPIEELYRKHGNSLTSPTNSAGNTGNSKLLAKKAVSMEQKKAVADYFIAEMYLGAEMLMDRNYVSLAKLAPLFSFDVLVTMLKMDVDDNLKAAAARLLMYLYIDTDPQLESTIPCLTRPWSEIALNEIPKMPFVEPVRAHLFGIVQHMLSEHIQGLQGTKWTRLSLSMFEVLRMLVSFNFYGTLERMKDIVEPLIIALDRRQIDYGVGAAGAQAAADSTTVTKSKGPSTTSYVSPTKIEPLEIGDDASADYSAAPPPRDLAYYVDKFKNINWHANVTRIKIFVDSMRVMITILFLVFVAVGITIAELVLNIHNPPLWMVIVQWFIFVVFIVEVSTRFFSYWYLYGSTKKFWKSPYNLIDVFVISIDIVFIILPSDGGGAGAYARVLRLVRLVRLARLLRAARVVAALVEDVDVVKNTLISATRYTKSPIFELDAMVQAIEILLLCQSNIEDRNVSLLLRYFYKWESGEEKRSPSELFDQVMVEANELALHSDQSDDVFIDLIMFVHPPLVQRVLDVLMAHYTRRRTLLHNAENVQLLVSGRRERQYKLIDQMLFQLDLNIETHELWGELENEQHHATNKQTIDMLTELIEVCCIRRSSLDPEYLGSTSLPDVEIQHLLRNLGCISTCLKVVKLLEGVEEEETEDGASPRFNEAGRNILHLASLGNTLLYWFFLDNKINQEIGYAELDTFIDVLDMNVKAHLVLKAIFHSNEKLIKLIPHSYIDMMVERIVKDGRNPVYLSLLSAITNVGEKNFTENQYDIAKQLTDSSKQHHLSSFIVPVTHKAYKRKCELMAPLMGIKNLDVEDLPPELQYHCRYLEVVANCTVGSMNTTIVEAKIQAAFEYIYILQAILDPNTILIVKLYLTLFYYNGIIDVAMEIPGLEHSAYVWRHLESLPTLFDEVLEELKVCQEHGSIEAPEVDRHKIEYALLCARITNTFFRKYYDPVMFKVMEDREEEDIEGRFVMMTPAEADDLFRRLHTALHSLSSFNSAHINKAYKLVLVSCMTALTENTMAFDNVIVPAIATAAANANIETIESGLELVEDDVADANDDDKQQELRILEKYDEFIASIKNDSEIAAKQSTESLPFINVIADLPYLKDKHITCDVRYETFIRKLVQHSRSKIEIVSNGNEKRLDAQCTLTTTWLMQAFRTMIENKWGMDIYERDDDGGEEEDEMAKELVEALNYCGAMILGIELIAVGVDPELQTQTMYFGVAMLLKEGGALAVQETIYDCLGKTDSELFFRQVKSTVNKLILWHQWRGAAEEAEAEEAAIAGAVDKEKKAEDGGEEEEDEVELPSELIILRFLQLFCEGHYKPNQDILREQPHNHSSINLLESFVEYFKCLSLLPCRTSTLAGITVANLILEIIQGPCEKNQEYLVLNTELIETLNRVLRAKVIRDCVAEEEVELKKTCIDIFQGLLEGQSLKGPVYERVFSVIHFDVLQALCKPPEEEEEGDEDDEDEDKDEKPEVSEDEEIMQTESVVLLNMLFNYKPSLRKELGMASDDDKEDDSATGVIEVVWRGEILRKFFHIPLACKLVAKSSTDALVFEVDRSNAENQLLDFIERGKVLHMEVKHQEVLIEYGLDQLFNRNNQEYATWFAFFLACLINVLLLINFTLNSERSPVLSVNATKIIFAVNIIQLVTAFFTFMMFLLVRCPVKYQVYEKEGLSKMRTLMLTAMDFQTVYYFGYCIIALLGLIHANFWSSFLLLDLLMKNSTARDVVKAVYNPIKSLSMSLVFLVIVVYVYSLIVFFNFRTELAVPNHEVCYNLWECFKAHLDLGLRHVNFIADLMSISYDWRELLDMFGFAGIKTLLLNLVFGIIIESFAQLREENDERRDKIINSCFICGIDKETFDRASDGVDGFKSHIVEDHNMWNYLYFLIFIWEQDKDDDDGLEQFIRRCIEKYDVQWFPIGKALSLSDKINEDEFLNKELSDAVKASSKNMANRVLSYRADVGSVLEGLTTMLKNDTIAGGGTVAHKIANQLQAAAGIAQEINENSVVTVENSHANDGGAKTPVADGSVLSSVEGFDLMKSVRSVYIEIHEVVLRLKDIPSHVTDVEAFLRSVSCRILCDQGTFSISSSDIWLPPESPDHLLHVTLYPEEISVADCFDVLAETRSISVQVVYSTNPESEAKVGASTDGDDNNVRVAASRGSVVSTSRVLGIVDIPLVELMQGTDTEMEYVFEPLGLSTPLRDGGGGYVTDCAYVALGTRTLISMPGSGTASMDSWDNASGSDSDSDDGSGSSSDGLEL